MDSAHNFELSILYNEWDAKTNKFKTIRKPVFPEGIKWQENRECWIHFISKKGVVARLYMPGLDIPIRRNNEKYVTPPDPNGWHEDKCRTAFQVLGEEDEKNLYKHAFRLFQNDKDSEYDPLRVGCYDIQVECNGQTFSTQVEVIPNTSLMNREQWNAMRDEVEREYAGLARDIVRQSLGFKEIESERLPAEKLYRFQVFRFYNSNILAALVGIQRAPKSKIVIQYQELPAGSSCKMDSKSIQMKAISGKRKNCVYTPKKYTSFDIPENRLLKKIIGIYDRELSDFLTLIAEAEKKKAAEKFGYEHKQTRTNAAEELANFKAVAEELRKTSYVIKSQPWYREINPATTEEFPHSFAMDPRYGTLYKMYQKLQKGTTGSDHDAQNYFSWKASHALYEMWCFITLCRAFVEDDAWELIGSPLTYENISVFPTLKPGTALRFDKKTENLSFDLIYNRTVDVHEANDGDPFYFMNDAHTLPDIRIDLYTKDRTAYWGTMILECKYRTIKSFWDAPKSEARRQILDYYACANTNWTPKCIIDGKVCCQRECFQPVKRVIALTPDSKMPQSYDKNKTPYVGFLTLKPMSDGKKPAAVIHATVDEFIYDFSAQCSTSYSNPFLNENTKKNNNNL